MMTLLMIVAILLAPVLMPVLAAELRHELLTAQIADGTTSADSNSEFRNDSSRMMHIREINYSHRYGTFQADEVGQCEISKSPTFASVTNNNVFFTYLQRVGGLAGTTGAASDDHAQSINGGFKWARGQLTLEPNESLFVNVSKSSGGFMNYHYRIGYHY